MRQQKTFQYFAFDFHSRKKFKEVSSTNFTLTVNSPVQTILMFHFPLTQTPHLDLSLSLACMYQGPQKIY